MKKKATRKQKKLIAKFKADFEWLAAAEKRKGTYDPRYAIRWDVKSTKEGGNV